MSSSSTLNVRGSLCGRALLGAAAACLAFLSGCGDPSQSAGFKALQEQLAATQKQVQELKDIHDIEKLNRAYGYYVDKGLWDQVVDLFSDNSTVEIEGGGIYVGKKGADRLFHQNFGNGRIGFADGVLFNHPQFQGIVDVDPGSVTAKGRWRTLAQVAWYGKSAFWNEGVYENEYVKEGGVWRFSKMKFWSTYFTPYDKGWAKAAAPPIGWGANMANRELPPDRPSDPGYRMYPRYFIPPFHYANPGSGRAFTAPERTKADEWPADKVTPEEYARKTFGNIETSK